MPATGTATLAPGTATNTPVPPSATPTSTPVPATATRHPHQHAGGAERHPHRHPHQHPGGADGDAHGHAHQHPGGADGDAHGHAHQHPGGAERHPHRHAHQHPGGTDATPTDTPTSTPVAPTATPTNTPTSTPVPPTPRRPTPPVAATATPTDTPTNTPVPPTATPTNTATNTPVPPTSTPTATNTPTATASHTRRRRRPPAPGTATATNTPTSTPTNTPTVTPPPAVTESITPGGPPVSLCTTLPNQNGRLTFSGTAGQQVSLWVTGSTFTNAFVTLERPDQTVQNLGSVGSSGAFFGPITLPSTGTYTFNVDPADATSGCATFQLFTGTDVIGAITPGGPPVQACNTVPGQVIRLVFSGAAGQRVSLRVTGSTLTNAFITLVRPDQTVQNLGGIGTSSSGYFFDTVTLPAAAPTRCTSTPGRPTRAAPPLSCLMCPRTHRRHRPRRRAGGRLQHRAGAGHGPHLQRRGRPAGEPAGDRQHVDQRLHHPGPGRPVGAEPGRHRDQQQRDFFDTVTLPATDTYTLHVDPGTTNTGCATLTLYDVPPDTTAPSPSLARRWRSATPCRAKTST